MYKGKFGKYSGKINYLEKKLQCVQYDENSVNNMNRNIFFEKTENSFVKITDDYKINVSFDTIDIFNTTDKILLGSGAFGNVYKGKMEVILSDGKIITSPIAIKTIKKNILNQSLIQSFCSELMTIEKLNHENIMKYHGYSEDTNFIYIFVEYINGRELYYEIKQNKLSNDDKLFVMKKLLEGLKYLHDNGVYHRDIKTENIMIERDDKSILSVKFIDFGFSCEKKLSCDKIHPFQGTPMFVSPEFSQNLFAKNNSIDFFKYYDLWALGVCFYLIMAKSYLKKSLNDKEYMNYIKTMTQGEIDEKIDYFFVDESMMPENLKTIKEITKKLLTVNYLERQLPTIAIDSSALLQKREQIFAVDTSMKLKKYKSFSHLDTQFNTNKQNLSSVF